MNALLAVLPFHSGDAQLALKLLKWTKRLNNRYATPIVLAADSKTPADICKEIGATAREQFKHVIPLSIRVDAEGVRASNAMFHHCCKWVKDTSRMPFLWMEPDSVPTKTTWLNELRDEYAACPTGYMGTLVAGTQPTLPAFHMPGCSVYPQNAFDLMAPFCNAQQTLAWDMGNADTLIKQGHVTRTNLIQSLWGQHDKPPTFVAERVQGQAYEENVMTGDFIKNETVLYHRCKDGSLFDVLANKLKLK